MRDNSLGPSGFYAIPEEIYLPICNPTNVSLARDDSGNLFYANAGRIVFLAKQGEKRFRPVLSSAAIGSGRITGLTFDRHSKRLLVATADPFAIGQYARNSDDFELASFICGKGRPANARIAVSKNFIACVLDDLAHVVLYRKFDSGEAAPVRTYAHNEIDVWPIKDIFSDDNDSFIVLGNFLSWDREDGYSGEHLQVLSFAAPEWGERGMPRQKWRIDTRNGRVARSLRGAVRDNLLALTALETLTLYRIKDDEVELCYEFTIPLHNSSTPLSKVAIVGGAEREWFVADCSEAWRLVAAPGKLPSSEAFEMPGTVRWWAANVTALADGRVLYWYNEHPHAVVATLPANASGATLPSVRLSPPGIIAISPAGIAYRRGSDGKIIGATLDADTIVHEIPSSLFEDPNPLKKPTDSDITLQFDRDANLYLATHDAIIAFRVGESTPYRVLKGDNTGFRSRRLFSCAVAPSGRIAVSMYYDGIEHEIAIFDEMATGDALPRARFTTKAGRLIAFDDNDSVYFNDTPNELGMHSIRLRIDSPRNRPGETSRQLWRVWLEDEWLRSGNIVDISASPDWVVVVTDQGFYGYASVNSGQGSGATFGGKIRGSGSDWSITNASLENADVLLVQGQNVMRRNLASEIKNVGFCERIPFRPAAILAVGRGVLLVDAHSNWHAFWLLHDGTMKFLYRHHNRFIDMARMTDHEVYVLYYTEGSVEVNRYGFRGEELYVRNSFSVEVTFFDPPQWIIPLENECTGLITGLGQFSILHGGSIVRRLNIGSEVRAACGAGNGRFWTASAKGAILWDTRTFVAHREATRFADDVCAATVGPDNSLIIAHDPGFLKRYRREKVES